MDYQIFHVSLCSTCKRRESLLQDVLELASVNITQSRHTEAHVEGLDVGSMRLMQLLGQVIPDGEKHLGQDGCMMVSTATNLSERVLEATLST